MSTLPDFTEHGYEVEKVLGSNPEGGRTAYRATEISTGNSVVIKRFSFASEEASWDGYEVHQREIDMLEDLDHPRIPAYLGDFQTRDGFCLVQEFCTAPPMSERKSWSVKQVGQLARSILEVLSYLQNRMPPMVHRDIKPENILVDDDGNAFLVDFGLARADRARATTMAVGTPGYMPPEQLFGQQISEATDLYAVGASLLTALTGTPSNKIGSLVSSSFEFDLSTLPDKTSPGFRRWLRQMVAPDLGERFQSADEALRELDDLGSLTRSTGHSRRSKSTRDSSTSPQKSTSSQKKSLAREAAMERERAIWDEYADDEDKNKRGAMIILAVFCVVAIVAVIFVVVRRKIELESPTGERATTLYCDSEMIIGDDIEMTQPSPAIQTRDGCDLTITNAKLVSKKHGGLTIKGGKVRITNATVEAKGNSVEVWDGELIIDNSTLKSTGELSRTAMVRGGTVTITNSTLQGGQAAISVTKDGVALKVSGSEIEGGKYGVSLFGGESEIDGTTVKSPNTALLARNARLTLGSGVGLEGGIAIDPSAKVTGLDGASVSLGEAAEQTWVNETCAPILQCVTEKEILGEFIVDLRATIGADGVVSAPEFVQVKLDPTVKRCVTDGITGLQMMDADGEEHTVRCTTNGNLMAGGAISKSVHFRME